MMFCSVPNCKSPNFSKDKLTGKGFCRSHQTKRTDFDRRTIIQKAIAKQNSISTKVRSLNNLEGNKDLVDSKSVELNKWFSDRAKELKGFCANCGGKTTKGNLKYERYSICHILEKSKVKSVATHPLNFIELCYFGNSCHTNMDNKTLEMQDMKCWKEIQFRFEKMYPSISKEEYQFIPDVLIQSL